MNRPLQALLIVVVSALTGTSLSSCKKGMLPQGAMPNVPGVPQCTSSLMNVEAGTVGDFGTTRAAMQIEAFLNGAVAVQKAALAVETDLVTACTAIGTDLGLAADRMQTTSNEPGAKVRAACTAASAEIQAQIQANMPRGTKFRLVYQPPVCTADMNVAATAAAECDANVQANAEVECEGRLAGRCSGECTGSCSGSCNGSCSGECSGKCGGTCNGTCEGRCQGRVGADGQCNGRCTGTCTGTCSTRCEGTCSAECGGSCEGECSGSCSVELEAPRCEGNAQVDASAECKAQAEVRASAQVHCTEPTLKVAYTRTVPPAAQARLEALVRTLGANYPKIVVAMKRLQVSLVPSASAFARASVDFAAGIGSLSGELGAQALAAGQCVTTAAQGVAAASASVNVSVDVSVQASASASAEGSAGT